MPELRLADPDAVPWDPPTLLAALRARGAGQITDVRFRSNRRTIWSITQGRRRLNLHVAFRNAPLDLVEDLATIAREAGRGTRAARSAAGRVADWAPLREEMGRIRTAHRRRAGAPGPGPCCASAEQREYLDRLYRHLNERRFRSRLPRVPLRLSNRMTRRLGHMAPGSRGGPRPIREIALNVDLMLAPNDPVREETLLHEMAHADDYLRHGTVGHGATWRRIALDVGCDPRACRAGGIRRRPRGHRTVTRVPPDPS